ncbi:hypothetical protein CPT_Silvanus_062 [Stenotrophomonas phage Silvanus]|nr:hypothetical protein CPT_Silvanus_062 [Stenotrophomonas phage Silvanus]
MLIPDHALPLALSLLAEMNAIRNPTEDQRRFIGTLRKATGMKSNNQLHQAKKEAAR